MDGENEVLLIGQMSVDPTIHQTRQGTHVCNFRMATKHTVRDDSGNETERTDWHRVVVWGNNAQAVHRSCAKGSQVYVRGRLASRTYQPNEGGVRHITEVVAQRVKFLDRRQRGNTQPRASSEHHAGGAAAAQDRGAQENTTAREPAGARAPYEHAGEGPHDDQPPPGGFPPDEEPGDPGPDPSAMPTGY